MSSPLEVEHVDFISVPVSDVERSIAFYGDTLELPQTNKGAWPEFKLGDNVFLYLVEPKRFGVQKWGPHAAHIVLRVADVAAAKEALEAKGVEFGAEIFDTGVCHMAFFHDPDGNALMFHRRYAPNE
jgi:catechol 2,3-dioxygenase-like lactoylglutathione lyase family enzyme